MDPGSGESRGARRAASSSCFSSENRWKNDEAWTADRRPISGVSEVRAVSGGSGSLGFTAGIGDGCRNLGSNASPGMKGTGKVSGVELNNWCPEVQNSIVIIKVRLYYRNICSEYSLTSIKVRRQGLIRGEAVHDSFPDVISDTARHVKEESTRSFLTKL